MSANPIPATSLLTDLAAIVGDRHVLTSEADRDFYAMDVYNQLRLPLAVVQPGSVEELQQVVRTATAAGIAVVTRGGGASYTDGYLPTTGNSITIDVSRLDRIIEINATDMYVTVEPGVTWEALWRKLGEQGLRTTFWGPFSGLKATVGGSMSQNSASLGSGNYGISADAVLTFEIVLASGEILKTGSRAAANGSPFFRWYGPDLTGLFTGDAGALGIKARISLRLIKAPKYSGAASFGFDTFEQMAAGMAAAAREGVIADNFGLDPRLQQGQLGKTNAKDAIAAAFAVAKTARNPIEAGIKLLKMAVAGKSFLKGYNYSAHYTVEGVSQAEVNGKLAVLRAALEPHGNETANTIPTVIRAMPFIPLYPILGPKGERWVPQHGIVPFSKVGELHGKLKQLYADNAARMQAAKVDKGAMFMTVTTHGFLYEPVFYWEDDRTAFHKRYLPKEYLDMLPEYPANPEGRALVRELRGKINAIFASVGSIHMQVGKSYPYMTGRDPEAARLLRELKQSLDPRNLVNPGALQL
ncbi:MAG: FAD-binding oxidoreductase [Chromatiales bacterium]|jgi:FAD/FMN-containing dehydrogenase|nr:FAD-binding oxidoreductase [Chromatiales bacterium]